MKTKKGINELLKTCGMIVFQIFQIWKELKESQVEILRLKARLEAFENARADRVVLLRLEDGGECVLNIAQFETICSSGAGSYITMKGGTVLRFKESPEAILELVKLAGDLEVKGFDV